MGGSNHPGRLLKETQWEGLPLHWDLLHHSFRQVDGVIIQEVINPWKSDVFDIVRGFVASVPAGDSSMFIFTGHGIQARGEQYLVFASKPNEVSMRIEPLLNPATGMPFSWPNFRKRDRMVHVDAQMSAKMGSDWLRKGWTISRVDGIVTKGRGQSNRAVVRCAQNNSPFEITFSRNGNLVDFVSYDEMRSIFADGGPSAHFVDACRVVHDDALGFKSDEKNSDAVPIRQAFLSRRPIPPNIVTAFAVAPGRSAMHEGVGRNYDFGNMMMGHSMEEEGLLESEYANRIKEEWMQTRERDGSSLQYHTSFFVEAFVHSLGELHLEGPSATLGDLLKRIDACPFGRFRKFRSAPVFVGDDPVLEAGSSAHLVESWRFQFQGDVFIPPEEADQ